MWDACVAKRDHFSPKFFVLVVLVVITQHLWNAWSMYYTCTVCSSFTRKYYDFTKLSVCSKPLVISQLYIVCICMRQYEMTEKEDPHVPW